MKHISTLRELQNYVNQQKQNKQSVGFVPTVGALHGGHMSLINRASQECDVIICSIFVNPTQFDDPDDLRNYPRTLKSDLQLLEDNECDVCFTPSVKEVYPKGAEEKKEYNIGRLEYILEGETRPGHYQGVAQVVHRLLEMVNPDILFLGQKDYQQVKILSQVIEQEQLPVQVTMCSIIREPSGLAMSSRNVRLKAKEKEVANELFKTIKSCKKQYKKISLEKLEQWGKINLNLEPLIQVDYFTFRDAETLEEIEHWDDSEHIILLGAIFLGNIRLIDNMIIC